MTRPLTWIAERKNAMDLAERPPIPMECANDYDLARQLGRSADSLRMHRALTFASMRRILADAGIPVPDDSNEVLNVFLAYKAILKQESDNG